MEKKEDRRITLTKQLLKNALIELLKEKDIYRISIRELCERANVNRSTFYKYYGSQFDLLAEMEDHMVEVVSNTISSTITETVSSTSDVEQCVLTVCRYIEENLEITRILINNNVDSSFAKKIFQQTNIQESIIRSFSPYYPEEDLEYIYSYVTSGCFQIIRIWINKENREPAEKIAQLFQKIFHGAGEIL